jgi:hypothetical protein
MNRSRKASIFIVSALVISLAVALGIALGISRAGRNAENTRMIENAIILMSIESKDYDAAGNWASGNIANAHKGRSAASPALWSFFHYFRIGSRIPEIPESLEGVILKAVSEEDHKSAQASSGQPATRFKSDSEGGDKPQPEVEGRSR